MRGASIRIIQNSAVAAPDRAATESDPPLQSGGTLG